MSIRSMRFVIGLMVLVIFLLAVSPSLYRHQQRLTKLQSECVAANREKNWGKLETLARESLALQSDPVSQYWLGLSLKGQHEFKAAFHAFESIPTKGPRGIEAAVERMEIQFHIFGKPLEAVALANDLLKLDRKLASPRRHLVYFHAMMPHRAELIQQIKLAIETHVDIPENYVYLLTIEDAGFRDAVKVLQKWSESYADSVDPESIDLNCALLAATIRVNRFNVLEPSSSQETAEKYLSIKSEIVPKLRDLCPNPNALDALLLVAMDNGDTEDAARLLKMVPDSAVDDPCFWRYRGWYSMRTGDLEQAELAYQRTLELHPLGWQARNEYSSVLRLRGRNDEAAAAQLIASQGSELFREFLRLPHARNVSNTFLKRMATYAVSCQATDIANGIWRRQQTMLKTES